MNRRCFVISLVVGFLACSIVLPLGGDVSSVVSITESVAADRSIVSDTHGTASSVAAYIVLEMPDSAIISRGYEISSLLNSTGVLSELVTVDELPTGIPSRLNASAIILDASLGSEQGSALPDSVLSLLIRSDRPLILVGRAAWVLHRLRDVTTPVSTAPLELLLHPHPRFGSGAVFLSWPSLLEDGVQLTYESGVVLPDDPAYHEMTTLANLTGTTDSSDIAPLRLDSWPLDTLLFGPEDPAKWSLAGKSLFVNSVAFVTSMGETPTTCGLSDLQADADDSVSGGFVYWHEPTLEGVYWAAQAIRSLSDSSEWTQWCAAKSAMVETLLNRLYVDLGTEAQFKDHWADSSGSLTATAKGLWLVSSMSLAASFDRSKLTTYLSSRQAGDGGWSSDVSTTYHVVEGLTAAGNLGSIDSGTLETWLRSCVITAAKTSDPDLWGGIAQNPTALAPSNFYASQFVLSLRLIGRSHDDAAKLTQWILTRTSLGDGSFENALTGGEVVRGTAGALTAMDVMNTLSPSNMSTVLSWLLTNQLPSGGFGLEGSGLDILAKMEETALIARSLCETGFTGSPLADRIQEFIALCESPSGFEIVEPLPTLLWSSWLAVAARASHGLGLIDLSSAWTYLDLLDGFGQYPMWDNITVLPSPEYEPDQYRTQSVWSHYLGANLGNALGTGVSAGAIGETVAYIYYCQATSGHYRPTKLMGTAHMQHTVAAVETLYQIASLDQIAYRSTLNSAVMSSYSSGKWSTAGWTLRPFVGKQSVIDFLCTRTALRLGLLDESKAAEIQSEIASRLQYTDLWALSADIASIQLLVANNLLPGSAMTSFNASAVLSALRSSFSSGWLNSSPEWQPIFTAYALETVARLGLRAELYGLGGLNVSASVATAVNIGDDLSVSLSIDSPIPTHTVYVYCVGEWMRFDSVSNSDTLLFNISGDFSVLGTNDVYVMVWDWGCSRAYVYSTTDVTAALSGNLEVYTPVVLEGDLVNTTAVWAFDTGGDAGPSDVTVRLGDGLSYLQWTYTTESPLALSLSSEGLVPGLYDLRVTVTRPHCSMLTLADQVRILERIETHIESPETMVADVQEPLLIPYELRTLENETLLSSQMLSVEIRDSLGQIVYHDSQVSTGQDDHFVWTPQQRGPFTYRIEFCRNGTLDSSQSEGSISVYENTVIMSVYPSPGNQGSVVTVTATLTSGREEPLSGQVIHVLVTSPSGQIVIDSLIESDSDGSVEVVFELAQNGAYEVDASFDSVVFLYSSYSSCSVISWSTTDISIGGVGAEELISEEHTVWARITDYSGAPVQGVTVSFQVLYLPSTLVSNVSAVTNSTGFAFIVWAPTSPGSFRLTAIYSGSPSRAGDTISTESTIRVPVSLAVSHGFCQVGHTTTVSVTASDHLGGYVSGLVVLLTIRDAYSSVLLQVSRVTDDGVAMAEWTPTTRGPVTISVKAQRQSVYESATTEEPSVVFEQVEILSSWNFSEPRAVTTAELEVILLDQSGACLPGVELGVVVTLIGTTILQVATVSDLYGSVSFSLLLTSPGALVVTVTVPEQGYLLGIVNATSWAVLGDTKLTTNLNGLPVLQGRLVGVVVTLVDWNGAPLVGGTVRVSILYSNSTLRAATERLTGVGGICTISHCFDEVGDFIVVSQFFGSGENGPASLSQVQRVQVVPSLVLIHEATAVLGQQGVFEVGLVDALGQYIVGRPLALSISSQGEPVFEVGVISDIEPVPIYWTPSWRGTFELELVHPESFYYLPNSTLGDFTVFEVADGLLSVDSQFAGLSDLVRLNYTLATSGETSGVPIVFEVLGIDFVPVWTMTVSTSGTGVALAEYIADDTAGVLTIRARPSESSLLIGGECQTQLTVITECQVSVVAQPAPPVANELVNISMEIEDELGTPVSGISVSVTVTDPFGNPVRLGYYSNSVTLTVNEGGASFIFTPAMFGLYNIRLTSGGATHIEPFDVSDTVLIFVRSSITVVSWSQSLEVGDEFSAIIELATETGSPLVGMDLSFQLDNGAGDVLGPFTLTTDSSGRASWTVSVEQEGAWLFAATFGGLGVYLPSYSSASVSVRYGTDMLLSADAGQDVVAGMTPLVIRALLTDSAGAPLEGRTLLYSVYHELLGLVFSDSVIQQSMEPEEIEIHFAQMGNYTIMVTFAGTDHYFSSSAALNVFVRGTTRIEYAGNLSIDRSDDAVIVFTVSDESGVVLDPRLVGVEVSLTLDGEAVPLSDRLNLTDIGVTVSLRGLGAGSYIINGYVANSPVRTGSSIDVVLAVFASTTIDAVDSLVSGLVDVEHSITFSLLDSLHEQIPGATVLVSLYDPRGSEILGSPLSTQTRIDVVDGVFQVEWTPGRVGNYTLVVVYEGDGNTLATEYSLVILTRHSSMFDLQGPESMSYSDQSRLTIVLRGGVGTIGNVQVFVSFLVDGESISSTFVSLNSLGSTQMSLGSIPAGNVTVIAEFDGNSNYAPCSAVLTVLVKPITTLTLVPLSGQYVGDNLSIQISASVLGVSPDWTGILHVRVYDPDGDLDDEWQFLIESRFSEVAALTLDAEGVYNITAVLEGLPGIDSLVVSVPLAVSARPLSMPLDAGTAPLVSGGAVLVAVGYVLRRKLKSMIDSLPSEWAEDGL